MYLRYETMFLNRFHSRENKVYLNTEARLGCACAREGGEVPLLLPILAFIVGHHPPGHKLHPTLNLQTLQVSNPPCTFFLSCYSTGLGPVHATSQTSYSRLMGLEA